MGYSGDERIETNAGNRPKVSRIHMVYMIYVVLFVLFRVYAMDATIDAQIRNTIFIAMAVIGIVLMLVVVVTNRKMENKKFAWNNWAIGTILFAFNCLHYVFYFLI